MNPVISKRLQAYLQQGELDDGQALRGLLETVCQVLLDMPVKAADLRTAGGVEMLTVAGQLLRGVVFHVAGDDAMEQVQPLQVELEKRCKALDEAISLRESLCQQLRVREEDLGTVRDGVCALEP